MEKFANIKTAQDLFEFLSDVPEQVRKVLPVHVYDATDSGDHGELHVSAFEVRDEQGNLERGFTLGYDST